MKKQAYVLCKVVVLMLLFVYSPLCSYLVHSFRTQGLLTVSSFYQPLYLHNVPLRNYLALSFFNDSTIPLESKHYVETKKHPQIVPQAPSKKNVTKKRIYIYNTHQKEGYEGGKSVMDASAILAKKLEKLGYEVVLETNDFEQYMAQQGWNYNDLYKVSYKYLSEALVNYNGFDFIIDFHRDSVPREASYFEVGNKRYAKCMVVVGGLGRNAEEVKVFASTFYDIMNKQVNGILKHEMVREAYYNQEVAHHCVLIEVGSDHNTFDEIKNSVSVLAKGIDEYLRQGVKQ